MKRRTMSRSQSKKSFRKATGVHKINNANPRRMRGGIRL